MASGRRNGGISLVEVLLACVLLVVLAVPILDALRGLRLGYAHTADRTTASFVAQAVLEELRYRLYAFYRSDDPTKSLEQFLASLAEQDARVASWRDDERSRYFARFENLQGTGLHGFTPDRHPEIYARLYDMLCTVTVQTPFPAVDGGPPEEGLAEVEVRVSWPGSGGGENRPWLALQTVVTCRQHESAADDDGDDGDAAERGGTE